MPTSETEGFLGKIIKFTFRSREILNAVVEEGDSALLQAALGDIAKARGMSDIAKCAGVGRESLYKSLSPSGNPSFQTILKVIASLGLKMEFVPAAK